MGRPRKTLAQLVRDGTFLARRPEDRRLLLGPPLQWAVLASLQSRYRTAASEPERRELAREFERLVRYAHAEAARLDGGSQPAGQAALQAELERLGRPGSIQQLLAFFPAYLAHTKGPLRGQPFELEPWQRAFLREFHRRDQSGRRLYRLGLLAIPRGCGKTQLAAGLALYELLSRSDAPEIYLAAGSKEQAGICFQFARDFVEQGPLADWVHVKGKKLACPASGGTLEVISSEGTLQHGRAPAVAIVDELHAFLTERQEETYRALTTALLKRQNAYLLVITTAGFEQRSLLGRLYNSALTWPDQQIRRNGCLRIARDPAGGSLLYWYGAPTGSPIDDRRTWRNCNPASWIDLDELARLLRDPGLGEPGFRRLHLNQWTTVREAWLPDGLWPSLRSSDKIPDNAPIYVGVDVGISHDSTAVAWAHPLADGRILLRVKVWSANPKAAAHQFVPDGRVELEQIEQFILERLAKQFRIVELAFDPNFFHRSAEHLARRGIRCVEYLPASAPARDAYQTFYQLAREQRLAHNGDAVLAAHIAATAARPTDRGWKLAKLRNSNHIDATIACVLAVCRAQHHQHTRGPNIWWMEA